MSQGTKRSSDNNSGSGSGPKKMRADNITLRFLLLSKHAGGIIGKGGQTIKRLRSEYNATVNVPDSNSQERVLSIGATQENAIKVLVECLPLFHEPPYPINSNQGQKTLYEINFLVHSSQVGGIIGRAGFKIKELREQTNANIKVFQECLPGSTERIVALGGGEEEIVSVLEKIFEILHDSPIKGNVSLYDPSQEPWGGPGDYNGPPMGGGNMRGGNMNMGMNMGMRGGGGMRSGGGRGGRGGGFQGNNFGGGGGNYGGGGRGGNFNGPMGGPNNQNFGGGNMGGNMGSNMGGNMSGNMGGGNMGFNDYGGGNMNQGSGDFGGGENQTTQVTIPNDLAGAIIGKGGERIRNIRQRSGADIKISDPTEGKSDRIITITGTTEQIQYAQFLMQQSVRQYSGKPMK